MLSKKLLLILFLVVIIITPACKKKEAVKYVDEKYNYTFAPPDNWKDKYSVQKLAYAEFYTEIHYISESNEENKSDTTRLILLYVVDEEFYEKEKLDPLYCEYTYIKHPKKDIGFLVYYPDYAVDDVSDLFLEML